MSSYTSGCRGAIPYRNKAQTEKGAASQLFFLIIIILNKLCYIFDTATEGRANFIYSFGFYIIICLEPSDSFAINSALLAQFIG